MSVQSIAKVLEHSKSSAGARLVLICIANHDGDGGSWPTIETLGREANLSERAVQYALDKLQSLGELCVHPNEGGTRGWRSDRRPNRYEILLDGVQPASPRSSNGVQSALNGVQSATERGAVGCTQTVQEPSTKPSSRASSLNSVLQTRPSKPARPETETVKSYREFQRAYPKNSAFRWTRETEKAWREACAQMESPTRWKRAYGFPTCPDGPRWLLKLAGWYADTVAEGDGYVRDPIEWLRDEWYLSASGFLYSDGDKPPWYSEVVPMTGIPPGCREVDGKIVSVEDN